MAIIAQAWRDMFVQAGASRDGSFTTYSDQDQAIVFLTDRTGAHARHRNLLCSLIGWDGDVLAERVSGMMAGNDFPPSLDSTLSGQKRYAEAIEQIRARWQHLKNPRALPASSVGAANAG